MPSQDVPRQPWRVCGLGLVLLCWLASVATAAPPRPLDAKFDEVVHEEIKVSSPFLLGSMLGESLEPTSRSSIFVWLPATEATRLCVQVRSIDGVYEARRRYDIETTEPGRYILPFDVQEGDLVASYGAGELVLDTRLGEDCSASRDLKALPSAWHGSAQRDVMMLFINSDRNEAKVIIPAKAADAPPAVFDCQAMTTDKRQRRFDRHCLIQGLAALEVSGALLRMFRFGEPIGDPRPLGLVAPLGY